MADKQKVLKGFECHRNGFCFSCPYNDDVIETTNCKRQLVEDAIELLREQPEIVRCKDCKHYMTIHCTCDGCCISDDWFCADGEVKQDDRT